MAEAPRPLLPVVLAVLAEYLDCSPHHALGPSDFQIYATPPGGHRHFDVNRGRESILEYGERPESCCVNCASADG